MSNDFINGLVATASPVTRRRASVDVLAVLIVGAIELIGFTYYFDEQILAAAFAASPVRMAMKIGLFGLLALSAMGLAIMSFDPNAKRVDAGTIGLVAAALLISILSFDFTMGPGVVVPSVGMACTIAVTSLALPVTLVLGLLMSRGASTQPGRSAFLVGLAGGAYGAFIFALQCPQVSFYYLALWYGSAIVAVVAAATFIMPRFLRW